MATIDLAKIALKSTANMSLNDRFQRLRQNQLKRQNNANNNNNNNSNKLIQNQNRLQIRQGSQKNRRLALQMANRPSVLAALRTKTKQNIEPIKQRLGFKRFNNQTINANVNRFQNQRNRNQKQKPINGSNFNNNPMNRNRFINQNLNRTQNRLNNQNPNRIQIRRNNTQNIGVIVGVRRKGLKKNGMRRTQAFKSTPNNFKSGFKPKRRVGQQIQNKNEVKTGAKKGFRINRNFNGTNNTGKQVKRRNVRNVKPNREQLDNDLDAYMAGTKSHLDAELDQYMAQTN